MIEKKFTICGKELGLAYCYATEIAFKDLSDGDITEFIQGAVSSIQGKRMPDAKQTLFLIVAAHMAYAQAKGIDEPAVSGTTLMLEASPEEVSGALAEILRMRAEFYHLPTGEPQEKSSDNGAERKGRKRKNA